VAGRFPLLTDTYAAEHGRVLVTNDRPLEAIAIRWMREGRGFFIETTVDVEDPRALIAVAREQYARFKTPVDVEETTQEKALAVADLATEELHAHPRYVTPTRRSPT